MPFVVQMSTVAQDRGSRLECARYATSVGFSPSQIFSRYHLVTQLGTFLRNGKFHIGRMVGIVSLVVFTGCVEKEKKTYL